MKKYAIVLIFLSACGGDGLFPSPSDHVSEYTSAISGNWKRVEYFIGNIDCTSVLKRNRFDSIYFIKNDLYHETRHEPTDAYIFNKANDSVRYQYILQWNIDDEKIALKMRYFQYTDHNINDWKPMKVPSDFPIVDSVNFNFWNIDYIQNKKYYAESLFISNNNRKLKFWRNK